MHFLFFFFIMQLGALDSKFNKIFDVEHKTKIDYEKDTNEKQKITQEMKQNSKKKNRRTSYKTSAS